MQRELSRKAYLGRDSAHGITKMHPPAYFYTWNCFSIFYKVWDLTFKQLIFSNNALTEALSNRKYNHNLVCVKAYSINKMYKV